MVFNPKFDCIFLQCIFFIFPIFSASPVAKWFGGDNLLELLSFIPIKKIGTDLELLDKNSLKEDEKQIDLFMTDTWELLQTIFSGGNTTMFIIGFSILTFLWRKFKREIHRILRVCIHIWIPFFMISHLDQTYLTVLTHSDPSISNLDQKFRRRKIFPT